MRKIIAAAAVGLMIFAPQAFAAETVKADSVSVGGQVGDRLGASQGDASQLSGNDTLALLVLGAASIAWIVGATDNRTSP